MGEKPLVRIHDKPMISYVIDAFRAGGHDVVVVATPKTGYTQNWCRAQGIPVFRAACRGYIEDIIETITELGETDPVFTCGGDLPFISPEIIGHIFTAYTESGRDACSVWVPRSLTLRLGIIPLYCETVDGVEASPAGVNILLGERIGEPQDELRLLLDEPGLAFNVNTREELERATRFLGDQKNR
jgi:adenosylcobinamide-phosphate guanylyltransferase